MNTVERHGHYMNDRVFEYFGVSPDSPEWRDWKWQYKNRITDAGRLSKILSLTESETKGLEFCAQNFRMAVTPYFASLMDPENPDCPVRLQAVPTADEARVLPWEKKDPLSEARHSPVENIVHRYPDRALFTISRQCAMYCRHCIRKTKMGEEGAFIGEREAQAALGYIRETPQIRDVLVSGGDPLMMDDARLEKIISQLRDIEHVEIIRIGTRAPSVIPMRITHALLSMLRKYQPVWINVQFNHPDELTPDSVKACQDIADAGIPLGNQSVLLKNVNDDAETMKRLLLGLVKARVRPYYLYQCDLCEGVGHFRTRVEVGIEMIRKLTGNISGFAVPKFVIDSPGGGGKIPINPEYIISIDDKQIVMRNYEGDVYAYPQPVTA